MALFQDMALSFWGTMTEMAPYLLFGFLVAGVLSVFVTTEFVERHMGGRGIVSVLKASIFGVPLPLCSCGVIPVAVSLRRHGASRGAAAAFLLSTPQTGVDSIMVTYGLLGPVFAVFRPLAALLTGVVGGWLVDAADRLPDNGAATTVCTDECCAPRPGHGRLLRMLRYAFVVLPRDIGRPMLAGVLAAGLIAAVVPDDFFASALGTGIGAMVVMMLAGIPLYVCATASVPIAAALIAKGVSPGAALAFLITGPATNAAAIVTIWKVLGRRTALIYLGTIAVAALLSGLLLDNVFVITGIDACHGAHQMLPAPLQTASAVLLLAVLGAGLRRPRHRHADEDHNDQQGAHHAET
jgi:uncharacterized protein